MTQLDLHFEDSRAPQLHELREQGVFSTFDEHFARSLCVTAGVEAQLVELALALVSRHARNGHVRLDLARFAGQGIVRDDGRLLEGWTWPSTSRWQRALAGTALVGSSAESSNTPLVLDDEGCVYLRRLFDHERHLADTLRWRATETMPVDEAVLREGLMRLFPRAEDLQGPDWQKLAALVAARRRLCVITGGPGTGKTSTVAKILALLAEQAITRAGTAPRIILMAPTGKAAARLEDSLRGAIEALPIAEQIREVLPDRALTIHRCLRPVRGSLSRFHHDRDNPLPADVVVVDEASMVDLALMRRLVDAVGPNARLVLLGDSDQLVSVEAGAVLGDVCNSGRAWRHGPGFADDASRLAGEPIEQPDPRAPAIADCVVRLRHSWRFSSAGELGRLATAILTGDADQVLELLGDAQTESLHLLPAPAAEGGRHAVHPELMRQVVDGYRPFAEAGTDVDRALSALERFRVLCAHRSGESGVEMLNALARAQLREQCELHDRWPILIESNDYELGLFNGDIGLVHGGLGNMPRAAFPDGAGVRDLSVGRLPAHGMAFAMSVHKSQGSEFDGVAVVLPAHDSPILTRELLYTAATRARARVTVHGAPALIRAAVGRVIERASGLRNRLWWR